MRKLIIIVSIVAVLVVLALLIIFSMPRTPDVAQYQYLKEPQIRTMANQKVIVVEAKGDPNVVGKEAFGLVMKTYFRTKGIPKGRTMTPPKARWWMPLETPKAQWVGLYAMPVPDTVSAIPEGTTKSGLKVVLDTWEYGEVAEILHIGPYDQEEPTVQTLLDFVQENGYQVTGPHEEEYLKGPTMWSKGNPAEYATIIRYQVTRTDLIPQT